MMRKSFSEFMQRRDLLPTAVGLVIALAAFELIQALVSGLVTPVIAALFGQANFEFLSLTIGDSEIFYGVVINAAITFAAIAAAVCFFVIAPDQADQEREGPFGGIRPCPECASSIPAVAKRCPRCTATVQPEPV